MPQASIHSTSPAPRPRNRRIQYSFTASRETHRIRARAVDPCGNESWSLPVTVSTANTKPDGNPDYVSVARGGSVLISPLVNDVDPDGDALRLALNPIIELPANGTAVRIDDSTIRYTPNAGYPASGTGSDVFRYRIVDSYGTVHSARVFVTVNP